MPAISYTQQVVVGGITVSGTVSRSADGQISHVVALPAAKAGELTTNSGGNAGEVTLAEGHGITTGATVNVYWAGAAPGRRYGVTVGTVAGNVVPISGGAGDDLPAEETPVTVGVQVEIDTDFDGDKAVLLAASVSRPARLDVLEEDDTPVIGLDLAANEPWVWADGGPLANPVADAIVGKVVAANSSSAGSAELRFAVLYNSAE